MISVWTADSSAKIYPTDAPGSSRLVRLRLARGEQGSFLVALRSDAPATITPVPHPIWGGTLQLAPPTWRVVGVLNTQYGMLPEVLLPAESFALPANTTIAILVTVSVPQDARPTTYANAFDLRTPIGTLQVYIMVDVWPFTVGPSRFKTAFSIGDCAGYESFGDLMLEHRMNPDDIWRNGTPDPAILSRWFSKGLTCFNASKADSAYSPTLDRFFAALAEQPNGAAIRAMGYTFGYDEKSTAYLDTVIRHGASYTDTTGAPDIIGAAANLAMLRSRYGLRSHTTARTTVTDLLKYGIDSAVREVSIYNYADGEAARAQGREQWSCCGFRAERTDSNLHARGMFWSQYEQRSDGLSYNMTNAWARSATVATLDLSAGPIIPYVFADGYSSDDLVLPGKDGPLASMRMIAIRDGMQDLELLSLFEARVGRDKARSVAQQVTMSWSTPASLGQILATRAAIAASL